MIMATARKASNRKLLEQLVACNDIALLVRKDIDSILNTPVISKLNVRRPHVEAQYKDAGHSDLHNRPIICGSFNPIHHGHTQMAEAASKRCAASAMYEMSIANADKATLNLDEIEARLLQFTSDHIRHDLVLTNRPLFLDKARLLPDATFVVGFDTAKRILDPKYYTSVMGGVEKILDDFRDLGTKFLVVGRVENPKNGTGNYLTVTDLDIPESYKDLFDGLDEAEFRVDISSTQLRMQKSS